MKKNIIAILLVLCMLAGCGSNKITAEMDSVASETPKEDAADMNGELMDYEVPEAEEESSQPTVEENRKIIERVFFQVETKEFDKLMEHLNSEISKVGGYVERSEVSGNSYYYEGNRYAEIVARIPSQKSDDFTTFVSENSTVTNKEITTEDVTLSYVDMESRVKALQTEKESLERLLEEAGALEEIIQIRDRLTMVIYEIESYQSQLRMYDNLIDYTTITIRINEVEKVTIIEEQTVWEEIGTRLKDNFSNVRDGFVDLFVGIISNIPYIIIIGVIGIVVFKVVKKVRKRVKNKE